MWGPRFQLVEMEDEDGEENIAIIIGNGAMAFDADEEDGDESGDED
jgi:hypothetical protein